MCLRYVLTSLVGDLEDTLVGGNDSLLGSVGSAVVGVSVPGSPCGTGAGVGSPEGDDVVGCCVVRCKEE